MKTGFNRFERRIAKGLEGFPFMRTFAKESYKRILYLTKRQSGFQAELHPEVIMMTPYHWAGLDEPGQEWFFGYYDKSPWSPDMNRVVFHHYDHHILSVMLLDRLSRKMHTVASTPAWNWQQGAMSQWLPSKDSCKIIFNTMIKDTLGSCIYNVRTGKDIFFPWPVQSLHPNGQEAVTLNYLRLQRLRPDYGYAVRASNFSDDQPLDRDGIWNIDLQKGTGRLILSLSDLMAYKPVPEMKHADHKVNHLIYSPSGKRFLFLHRFLGKAGKFSRLFSVNSDGTDVRLLLDERMVSHYHWQDDDHLIVWGRTAAHGDRYYSIDVNSGSYSIIGPHILDSYGDGHCTFSPDREWIVTDTYPDKARQRRLILFHLRSGRAITVGRFFSPWRYNGVFRCDLHPRFSPDGQWLSIDSVHEGRRKMYFIDISSIVNESFEGNLTLSL